jgi:hypothetical protein
MKSYISLLTIIAGIIMMAFTSLAQSIPTNKVAVLFNTQTKTVFSLQLSNQQQRNILTLTPRPVTNFVLPLNYTYTPGKYLSDSTIVIGLNLYTLERFLDPNQPFRDDFMSQVVKTNLQTGERTVLFQKANIWTFTVANDESSILIVYHLDKTQGSERTACVWKSVNQCDELQIKIRLYEPFWVPVYGYVIFGDGGYTYLYNPTTTSLQILFTNETWFVASGVYISSENSVVFAANPRNIETGRADFIRYQLNTNTLSDFTYDAVLDADYYAVNYWRPSLNQTYMLYGNTGSYVLVKTATGEFIQEFIRLGKAIWVTDTQVLIKTEGETPQLFLFDVTTKTSTILLNNATNIELFGVCECILGVQ